MQAASCPTLFRRRSRKLPVKNCWLGNYFVLLFPRFPSRLPFLEKIRVWKRSVQLINFPLLRDSRINNDVDKAKQRGCRFQVVREAYFAWANRISANGAHSPKCIAEPLRQSFP